MMRTWDKLKVSVRYVPPKEIINLLRIPGLTGDHPFYHPHLGVPRGSSATCFTIVGDIVCVIKLYSAKD